VRLESGELVTGVAHIIGCDESGRLARWEMFEPGQLDEARARFDELTRPDS